MTPYEHAVEKLPKYKDWAPTQFDAKGLGAPEHQEWRVLPVIQTRDSDALGQSNFRVAEAILDEAEANYSNQRFGHWGPGWFEVLLIDPNDEVAMTKAGEIICALSDYPVLDEMDWSELQIELGEDEDYETEEG